MITSKNTSINKNKLPASTKLICWDLYRGQNVLDFGGGKFDNLKEYLKINYSISLFIYDKYNRSSEENRVALTCNPVVIICNNVLNVMEDSTLNEVVPFIRNLRKPVIFSIYEGDKSGIGKITKKDCYQRNEKIEEYIEPLKTYFLKVSKIGKLIYCI